MSDECSNDFFLEQLDDFGILVVGSAHECPVDILLDEFPKSGYNVLCG